MDTHTQQTIVHVDLSGHSEKIICGI